VYDARFSADGKRLLTCSADATVRIWDIAKSRTSLTFDGHQHAVYCAEFFPQETLVLSGGYDDRLIVWNAHSGEVVWSQKLLRAALVCLAISPEGNYITLGFATGEIVIWKSTDLLASPSGKLFDPRLLSRRSTPG
jgi:WD40 repeat protein